MQFHRTQLPLAPQKAARKEGALGVRGGPCAALLEARPKAGFEALLLPWEIVLLLSAAAIGEGLTEP